MTIYPWALTTGFLVIIGVLAWVIFRRQDEITEIKLQLTKHTKVDIKLKKEIILPDGPGLAFSFEYNPKKSVRRFHLSNLTDQTVKNVQVIAYEESATDGKPYPQKNLLSHKSLDPKQSKLTDDVNEYHFVGCFGRQEYRVTYQIGRVQYLDTYKISAKDGAMPVVSTKREL